MMQMHARLSGDRSTLSRQLPCRPVRGMIVILVPLSPALRMPTPDHPTMSVRNTLQRWRSARGMTQQELATRAGVTRQTVMNIELGRTHPSILLVYRLADVLGVPVTDLFRL
jgi:putative transcriptional regulator